MYGEATLGRPALWGAAWVVTGFGLSTAWLCSQPATKAVPGAFAATLVATALGAELAASQPSSPGTRFAVTGAYLAAIACFWSPLLALITTIGAAVLGGLMRQRTLRQIGFATLVNVMACAGATLTVVFL